MKFLNATLLCICAILLLQFETHEVSGLDEPVEKSAVGEVERITMMCGYGYGHSSDNKYSCNADLRVQSDNAEVVAANGSHFSDKTNLDVGHIQFSGSMRYVPDGLGNIFKNLKSLHFGSYDMKAYRRSGFKNMENLVEIVIYSNYMEVPIEEDCLYDLPNLETLRIYLTYLEEIKEKTFINSPKLREVVVNSNKLEVLPKDLFKNNFLLEKVDFRSNYIKSIDEKFFANNPKLNEVIISSNHLEQLPVNLFEKNVLLKVVDLSSNSLKIIDINFADFENIQEIYLSDNVCTNSNSTYLRTISPDNHLAYYYTNLTEFDDEIRASCSPKRL